MKCVLHHDTVFGLVPMFDMDRENSIPTLFSSFLMILVSFISFVFAQRFVSSSRRRFYEWAGLALVFLFFSIDEFVSIHERLTVPARDFLNASGFFYFAWIIPYMAIALFLIIIYLPWFFRLPLRSRYLTATAAVLFFSGALGMEMLSGYHYAQNNQVEDCHFALLSSVEETLELSGLVVFIYALLSFLAVDHPDVSLKVSARKEKG